LWGASFFLLTIYVGGLLMAYKFSRGDRGFGDIEFEDDSDTGIDFEADQISLETDGTQRLLINNYGATITGSLELTGSAQSLIVLHTRDADTLKEIAFFKDGNPAAAMQVNNNEHLFIENENVKDIILRTNNQNTIRVFGQNQRVGIKKTGITANATLDVNGDTIMSGTLTVEDDLTVEGYVALNCYQEDGSTGKTDPSLFVGHAHIYSKLVSGHAEIFVRDSNGNVTQISPHTPEGEWQYFSRNTRTGKVVRVNMEKMIRKLEEITGESFMEEWYEDIE
tara:strand:+ start:611 stop:1450 length:840 start_codon:yes stop_codon:yes gene_type:complete